MLKQIVKSCLVAAMAVAMAAPAMAADVTVDGRTRVWLEQATVKDGPSTMQFKADGRLGASISGKAGGFTATAYQNFDIDSDGGESYATIREQNITLENSSMAIKVGRFSPYGVSKGMAYGAGSIYNAYWIGENVLITDITDHLTVNLKDLGLTAILGMNNYNESGVGTYNETVVGAVYGAEFGAVDLAAEYLSASTKIDEKDSAAAAAGGPYDGATFSALAVGVGYALSDAMGLAFNFENNSTQSGISGSDAEKVTIMELWFDLGLGNDAGISVGYGQKSTDDGTDDKLAETMVNVTYARPMGIATVFASYLANTSKDDDAAIDSSDSTIGAGVEVNF